MDFSVIIPTKSRASFVGRAIESVLTSVKVSVEVIIIDTNTVESVSFRDTELVLDRFLHCYPDCVFRISLPGANGSRARNHGVGLARGHYVAFLDDDDVFHPEKLSRQLFYLRSRDDAVMISCMSTMNCTSLGEGDESFRILDAKDIAEVAAGGVFINSSSIAMERSRFLESGGFDERLSRFQDTEFVLRWLGNNSVVIMRRRFVFLDVVDRRNLVNLDGMRFSRDCVTSMLEAYEYDRNVIASWLRFSAIQEIKALWVGRRRTEVMSFVISRPQIWIFIVRRVLRHLKLIQNKEK